MRGNEDCIMSSIGVKNVFTFTSDKYIQHININNRIYPMGTPLFYF